MAHVRRRKWLGALMTIVLVIALLPTIPVAAADGSTTLDLELTYVGRSKEASNAIGHSRDEGFNLPLDPSEVIFNSVPYQYLPLPSGLRAATWPSYHACYGYVETRHIRATFTLPYAPVTVPDLLFYTPDIQADRPDMLWANDEVSVYINGNYIGARGVHYPGAVFKNNEWVEPGDFGSVPASYFIAGVNTVDFVTEETCWAGGLGLARMRLTVTYDSAPPSTTAVLSSPANDNGWNNGPVTVTLSAADNPGGSGVKEIHYQVDRNAGIVVSGALATAAVTADGTHVISYFAIDQAGNQESPKGLTVRVDATSPTISGATSASANADGWYNEGMTVTFTCDDAVSGIAACSAPVLLGEGKEQSVTGTALDKAGNTASATVSGINIDLTAPVVTYTGNLGTYTVDQAVSIRCVAADSLSDLASNTCADVIGPAYSFLLGDNTYSASATDKAGNTGTGTTSFTVRDTNASLCSLTQQFIANRGVANSLCVKLENAAKQAAAGKTGASNNILQAYLNEVTAQSGKAITATRAEVLAKLANALMQ